MRRCKCGLEPDVIEAGWVPGEAYANAVKQAKHYAVQCDCGEETDYYDTAKEAKEAWEKEKLLVIEA